MPSTKRILIADDHKILREGLRTLVESKPGYKVVAEAEDGLMAVELATKLVPDVIIMDITMPGLGGIEATRRISKENSAIKIIALSMHSDKRFVAEMLNAGASGYLLKDCAFEEVADAIETVLQKQIYISPGIKQFMVSDVQSLEEYSPLSSREREVLQLVSEGKSTKDIADCLHVSVKTIEKHREHIMKKLKIFSIAELTKYALRFGISNLE